MIKQALNPTDLSAIKQYTLGGAAVGGGAALITSLMNYVNSLKQDAQEGSALDDDTLYVNVPGKKKAPPVEKMAAESPTMLGSGMAMAGGVLSSAAAYAAIKEIYNNLRRNQEQGKLDEAQQMHVDALNTEADMAGQKDRKKPLFRPGVSSAGYSFDKAAADLTGGDKLTGAPIAALLLMSVAAAAVSNSALKKTFTPVQPKPSKLMPRRVVLRSEPPAVDEAPPQPQPEEVDDTLVEKEAAEDWLDATELLLDMVANWDKSASHSDIGNLIGAISAGRHSEVVENLCTYGSNAMFDMLKGANEELLTKSASQHGFAVGLLARSSALAPTATTIAAAEFMERAPILQKIAMFFEPELEDALIKLAAQIRRIQRFDMFEDSEILKQAAALPQAQIGEASPIAELLQRILGQQDIMGDEDKSSGNVDNSTSSEFASSRGSDDSGEPNSEAPLQGDTDLVDGILGSSDKAQTMLA